MELGAAPHVEPRVQGWLSWQLTRVAGFRGNAEAGLQRALRLAERAAALGDGPGDGTHGPLATVHVAVGRHADAVAAAEHALARDPGFSETALLAGHVFALAGRTAAAVHELRRGMRLEPDHPAWAPGELAFQLLKLADHGGARDAARAAVDSESAPDALKLPPLDVLAAEAFDGDPVSARTHRARTQEIMPAKREMIPSFYGNRRDQEFLRRCADARVAAGMPEFAPVAEDEMAFALPDDPSIVVLPFRDLSGDADGWLADALTVTVIATPEGSPDMAVIARDTTLGLKEYLPAPRDAARRFGVGYVLDGSVIRTGDRARVRGRAGGRDGRAAGADHAPLDDVLTVLDDLSGRIFEEMQVELTLGEQARGWRAPAGDPETWRLVVQGLGCFEDGAREGAVKAVEIFEEFHRRRPGTGLRENLLASGIGAAIVRGARDDPEGDWKRVKRLAGEAVAAAPEDGAQYSLLACVAYREKRRDEAVAHADAGIALSPKSPVALM